ncbi:MAG: helix-turn-helix transcriptional regulator [Chlamydiota bacterium]
MSAPTKKRLIRRRSKKQLQKAKSIPWRKAAEKEITKYSEGGLMLRGCRYKHEITQKELAEEIGISQHHISEMENGKRSIGKEMAKKFAKFFQTDYRVFL